MLDITGLRVAQLGDIPGGNLVVIGAFGRRCIGIRIDVLGAPYAQKASVLCFDIEDPNGMRGNLVVGENSADSCLHIGKAIFVADAQSAISASDPNYQIAGNELLISDDSLVLAGRIWGTPHRRLFYGTNTGQGRAQPAQVLALASWAVGVRGVDTHFQELFRYAPVRVAT